MKKPLCRSVLFLICPALLAVSPARGAHLLVKDVLSEGGGYVESAGYLLEYSVGQVAVGQSMGTDHMELGGYWGWMPWGEVVAVEDEAVELVPSVYLLCQNYPNPFNRETKISYQLPRAGHVSLAVFNIIGQEVCRLVDWEQAPGSYLVTWNGADDLGRPVASGIYFYQLTAGEFRQVRKVLLLK